VTHAEEILGDVALDLAVEGEQAKAVRDGGSTLADALSGGLLGEVEVADETGVTLGLFDRVEALALEVLDEPEGGGRGVAGLDDGAGMARILSV